MKVVVLPGLDGTGALLTPFCDALPAGLVGQGISYPVQFTSYDDIFDWLTDRLPTEEFLIVAESFSGPLGIRFASAGWFARCCFRRNVCKVSTLATAFCVVADQGLAVWNGAFSLGVLPVDDGALGDRGIGT